MRVSQHVNSFSSNPRIFCPHVGKYGCYVTVVGAGVDIINGVQHLRALVRDDSGNTFYIHWDDIKVFFDRERQGVSF